MAAMTEILQSKVVQRILVYNPVTLRHYVITRDMSI